MIPNHPGSKAPWCVLGSLHAPHSRLFSSLKLREWCSQESVPSMQSKWAQTCMWITTRKSQQTYLCCFCNRRSKAAQKHFCLVSHRAVAAWRWWCQAASARKGMDLDFPVLRAIFPSVTEIALLTLNLTLPCRTHICICRRFHLTHSAVSNSDMPVPARHTAH